MSTVTPIKEPNRPFTQFLLSDIYTGPSGSGRWVPNVDDMVFDWDTGKRWRCTSVDYTTGLSQLEEYVEPSTGGSVLEEDILLGAGPGTQSESYRLYLNTEVLPFKMAFDVRLHTYNPEASVVKVFRGTDISDTGNVISAMVDQNDEIISENIPLTAVIMPQGNNAGVKAPLEGYCTEQLDDGDVVTVVTYSSSGTPLAVQKMLVMNTAFVRSANAAQKYVTSISLMSPFLSESDNKLLQYPINVPVQSAALMGRVEYSDGSSVTYPVDGTKFSLHGINSYVSSIVGQRLDLVLGYRLSEDEFSMNVQQVGNERFINEDYELETLPADGSYSVKLFTFPIWVDASTGYRLEHYLYTLDRDEIFNVTNQVELGLNSPTFQPKQYGGEQEMLFAIDLGDVDAFFKDFRHVQSTGITLIADGTTKADQWKVRELPGGTYYGEGVFARADYQGSDTWDLDLSSDMATFTDWLNAVYYANEPLYNPATESVAPEPTHFAVVVGNYRQEVPINQWDQPLSSIAEASIGQGKHIYLEFFRRPVSGDDLQLAVAAMPVHAYTT